MSPRYPRGVKLGAEISQLRAASSRIGELLVSRGLDRRLLDEAVSRQTRESRPLGEILVEMKAATEEEILSARAEQMGISFLLPPFDLDEKALDAVGLEWLSERSAVPLQGDSPRRRIALADPSDRFVLDDLRGEFGDFVPVLASEEAIEKALEGWMRTSGRPIALRIESLDSDASVPKWLDHLLERAVEERASDIHVEALGEKTRVRFRIDGVLYEAPSPPLHLHAAVISRLKVLSDLDIAERRIPQDGKFPRFITARPFDVRVSVIPTVYGEGAVLRLLERTGGLRLDDLRFSTHTRERLERLFKRSHGLVLATGPTGSGKTTSLYAALQRLNDSTRKIITIEDPVEYDLPGVEQIQVNVKTGLTFASGLRSVLRHDPDVILVGEIRDAETAKTAIQSSLTGHLVLSTLHTNDAPSSIARLIDMGVERFLVASALVGVLAQRLVRRICAECRAEIATPSEVIPIYEGLGLPVPAHLYQGRGCLACRGTGFRGRSAIGECLVVDEALREIVHAPSASTQDIQKIATQAGFRPLLADGLEKAREGDTTVHEVLRVALPEWE